MKIFDKNCIKLIFVGLILIVAYKSINSIGNILSYASLLVRVLMPLILGSVIALFVYSPVCRLKKLLCKTEKKWIVKYALHISTVLVYVFLFAIIALAIDFIMPVLYKNAEELALNIPGYVDKLNALLSRVDFFPELNLNHIGGQLLSYLDFARLNEYLSVITDIANSFVSVLVSIIISVYIVLDKERIFCFLAKLRTHVRFGEKTDVFIVYIKKIVYLFRSYFAGLFIDALLIGIFSTIVFSCFNVPYAVFLGLVVTIGNLIPFFGPIIAAFITYLIGMISLGPVNALWILAFQLVLGQIDGNLIQPRIVGSQVGVSPLLVLISVTVFGGLFGPVGMILGVPVCAAIKLVLDDYLEDGRIDG